MTLWWKIYTEKVKMPFLNFRQIILDGILTQWLQDNIDNLLILFYVKKLNRFGIKILLQQNAPNRSIYWF